MNEFKECYRWTPDNMPETTDAIIVISKNGIIKRLKYTRWNIANNSYSIYNEHIYKPQTNRGKQRYDSKEKIKKYGLYTHINLQNKTFSIHRLVANTFIPNPENKLQINHINGKRDDNRVENLEWCTNQENMDHAWNQNIRISSPFQTLTDNQKTMIIDMRTQYFYTKDIAEKTELSHETVRNFLNIYFNREDEILKTIRSFMKFINNELTGIKKQKNRFELKHGTIHRESFKTLKEAVDAKDKYISSIFNKNTGIYIRWNKCKE